MSEFPEWVEREVIGLRELSYRESKVLHEAITMGFVRPRHPDGEPGSEQWRQRTPWWRRYLYYATRD